ncbi:hypothetical protein DIPPA_08636 [Diplonema papillatum]|nr:hypothetical protein DIPPA_08636 [Diplonema papillatum]|eukprot:gene6743-10336_t
MTLVQVTIWENADLTDADIAVADRDPDRSLSCCDVLLVGRRAPFRRTAAGWSVVREWRTDGRCWTLLLRRWAQNCWIADALTVAVGAGPCVFRLRFDPATRRLAIFSCEQTDAACDTPVAFYPVPEHFNGTNPLAHTLPPEPAPVRVFLGPGTRLCSGLAPKEKLVGACCYRRTFRVVAKEGLRAECPPCVLGGAAGAGRRRGLAGWGGKGEWAEKSARAAHPGVLRELTGNPYEQAITASQFGNAVPWEARLAVDWIEKETGLGFDEQRRFKGNAATAHGVAREPRAVELYQRLLSVTVLPGGYWTRPLFLRRANFLGASPDGLVLRKPRKFGRSPARASRAPPDAASDHLLEVKCPCYGMEVGSWQQETVAGVPYRYFCQVQGQLHVVGASVCDFFVADKDVVALWRVRKCTPFWEHFLLPELEACHQCVAGYQWWPGPRQVALGRMPKRQLVLSNVDDPFASPESRFAEKVFDSCVTPLVPPTRLPFFDLAQPFHPLFRLGTVLTEHPAYHHFAPVHSAVAASAAAAAVVLHLSASSPSASPPPAQPAPTGSAQAVVASVWNFLASFFQQDPDPAPKRRRVHPPTG